MNLQALLNTLTLTSRTLPIVILYVTEGCNLRCMTCSYRSPLPGELTLDEIRRLAVALKDLGLRQIVYSGGEPLMRRDFPAICEVFKMTGVKQTLLTNGLLLGKRWNEIEGYLSEVIVSIDGPDKHIHDAIRGVESFDRIIEGFRMAAAASPRPSMSIRTVLQKKNFRAVIEMVRLARSVDADRISFLAADVLSESFGRDRSGPAAETGSILLSEVETLEFRGLLEQMISECREEFDDGFISETPERMYHIVRYFEAAIGRGGYPRNYCNAPMVSAVITSTGDLLPCFFLPPFANIRDGALPDLLNVPGIRSIRRDVRAYKLERCKTCVCTLHVQPVSALLDRV